MSNSTTQDNGFNTTIAPPEDDNALLTLPVLDYSASGFFTEADLEELLPLITAGNVRRSDIHNFLIETGNDLAPCPAGFVCDAEQRANCTKIRMIPVIYGFGDVLGGTFCPPDDFRLLNCPAGRYCPTPERAWICPAGKWCPHKTAWPEIECDMCDEGEENIKRDYYGFTVIYALFFLTLLYALVRLARHYRQDTYERFMALASRQVDALKMTKIRQAQQDRLEKVKPVLRKIMQRLPPSASAPICIDDDDGRVHYHPRLLFAALDQDHDGYLDMDQLQTILDLRPEQSYYFVKRMHALQGEGTASRKISRSCFCAHFLPVLQETCNFAPTSQEVEALFDYMDPQRTGFVNAYNLYQSPVAWFLTDPEINQMIKALGRMVAEHDKPPTLRLGHSASFWPTSVAQADPNSTFFMANNIRSRFTTTSPLLSRDSFVKYYPTVLKQVVEAPEYIPSSTLSQEQDDQEGIPPTITRGTVDITFEDLSLTVQADDDKVNVVNHVSGRIRHGSMTALMGGSGAGKTSLLNALCGRAYYGETTGKIFINGHEARIEDHKSLTGFVPQDDIVYAELTVKECLMYSARFSSPKGTSLQALEDLADATLANLGLSLVANSIVGDVNRRGISGGEKKRVNIGVELMAKPSILFLDEPTSGLDSSSALLVMQSLKILCRQQGVTVISVIHQPRKVIFDLFDSLVLLGCGGNMVYHGPVQAAEVYLSSIPKPYTLPIGESLADWLIDVSTGLLEPDEDDSAYDHRPGVRRRSSTVARTTKPTITSVEAANEQAKLRRDDLFMYWRDHFASIGGVEREMYTPPTPYDTPKPVERPAFWDQLKIQLQRNVLVMWRNRNSKIVDIGLIIVAVTLAAGFEGPVELTREHVPVVSFRELTSGSPADLYRNFHQFFLHAVYVKSELVQFSMKLGVITAVLLSLTATRAITAKRIEFFRESASGYDVNAYFAAINISGFFEYSLQMIIAGAAAFWLRNSVAYWYSFVYNFLIIMWLTVSWSLLLPLVVPGNNVVLAAGFFTAFFSLLFSGGLPPIEYIQLYYEDSVFSHIFSGFFSVTRFFIESMIVQEQRCLPPQSGYTLSEMAVSFPLDLNSFSLTSLAGNDESVVQRSCYGWYWSFWPALFVGLTVRYLAAGLIHVSGRGKQARKPFWEELRSKPWDENPLVRTVVIFCNGLLVLFVITCILLVMERGSTGVEAQEGLLGPQDEAEIDMILHNFVNKQAK